MEALKIKDILKLRKSTNIVHILNDVISYEDFFHKFLLPNYPCILGQVFTENWRSRKEWCTANGGPNFEFLQEMFGSAKVPVANCNKIEDGTHPEKMSLQEYCEYWKKYIKENYTGSSECLYLKNFHFNRKFPDYKAYETPDYFTSDWMNEFWDQRDDVNDDYRFVYMGPKGSWTPFHADVFRSYSWSANICGKKKWILFPPGEEECLRDNNGHLVFDVNSDILKDPIKYPKYSQLRCRIEVTQFAGEIIFVPSGWHHQVHNMEDTISINHNWLNGCNVDISWSYIKQGLSEVEKVIQEWKEGMLKDKEWYTHCQDMLKADRGIHFPDFFTFMKTIIQTRIKILQHQENLTSHQEPITGSVIQSVINTAHCSANACVLFDIQRVTEILEDMLNCKEFENYDLENKGTVMKEITELLVEVKHTIEKKTPSLQES